MRLLKTELPARLRRADDVATAEDLNPEKFGSYLSTPLRLGIVSGLAPLAVSLTIARVYGLDRDYLRAWPFVLLAAFAIAWSVAWYLWSASNVPVILLRSRAAFEDDGRFDEVARRWARDVRVISPLAIAGAAIGLTVYVALAAHRLDDLYGLPAVTGTWADGPKLWPKTFILCTWAIAAAVAAVPNLIGAAAYLRLVSRIGTGREKNLATTESLPVARDGFRALALFGLIGGVAWTIASATWAFAVALNGVRWDELLPVVAATLIGIAILVGPQLSLRQALVRIRHARVAAQKKETKSIETLDEKVRELYSDSTWPHGGAVLGSVALAAQIVIPIATTVATNVFTGDA